MAPCVAAYKVHGALEMDSAFAFPAYLQKDCMSWVSLPGVNCSFWLQYTTHGNCAFCFLQAEEQFIREQDFFRASPWDSVSISRIYEEPHGDYYLYKIVVSASGLFMKQAEASEWVSATVKEDSGLMKELSYIRGSQFMLWDEGEVSHGGYLELIIYRGDESERYRGSMVPFYFQHFRRFLIAYEQSILKGTNRTK